MSRNAELAGATLGHLEGLGVRHFVVCAGARNAPLVTSLLAVSERKNFRVWHYFDERTAAFFALGLSQSQTGPVAVVTTSGTACAELLPAAIEGYYSGIPLVLVTADRPAWYRGSGAPQAIEQRGIFGLYAPITIDVQSKEDLSWVIKWDRRAPLHLNVCFEEPSPEDKVEQFHAVGVPSPNRIKNGDGLEQLSRYIAKHGRIGVVLGALPETWKVPVEEFLLKLGAPVWAEATSGLRESEMLGDLLVRRECDIGKPDPDGILRIGGVPSLRFWRELETLRGIDVMSVSERLFSGLARNSELVVCDEFPETGELMPASGEDSTEVSDNNQLEWLIEKHPKAEPAMMRALGDVIPEDALVFLGNSMPIREWNLAAPLETKHPHCLANRGANGIDGEVATFLGASDGREEAWGIFGDLTALYDLNAPGMLSQLSPGRRRIVVMNNGGGRIFSHLPSLAGLSAEEKRVTENQHRRRFEAWAAMWDMDYVVWRAGKDAPKIDGESVLIEVLLENTATERFWREME